MTPESLKYGRVGEILADLNDEETERALLEHLLGGTSARQLSEILRLEGHPVGKTAINEWRKRNATPQV